MAAAAWAQQPTAATEPAAAIGSEGTAAAATRAVLIAPVQGSDALQRSQGESIADALQRALRSHGYHTRDSAPGAGQALVDCQTPECTEDALDAAGAVFAIVPAIWSRTRGGAELTLTLLERVGRSLNASAGLAGEPAVAAAALLDVLLARHAALAGSQALAASHAADAEPPSARLGASLGQGRPQTAEPARPHAWKAGPILLLAAGAGAFAAIGVAAGIKDDHQQLDPAAVGAWSAVGAAAIAGGVVWWVVGEKRRRATLDLHPTRIDFGLRF
jgi:hypothetical protein